MNQISIQRGEYTSQRFTLTQGGAALDITGATISFVVRATYPVGTVVTDTDAVLVKTVGAGITLTDPTNGIFDIVIDSTDTKSLALGNGYSNTYIYGVEVKLLADTGPRNGDVGEFILTGDIVRAL